MSSLYSESVGACDWSQVAEPTAGVPGGLGTERTWRKQIAEGRGLPFLFPLFHHADGITLRKRPGQGEVPSHGPEPGARAMLLRLTSSQPRTNPLTTPSGLIHSVVSSLLTEKNLLPRPMSRIFFLMFFLIVLSIGHKIGEVHLLETHLNSFPKRLCQLLSHS